LNWPSFIVLGLTAHPVPQSCGHHGMTKLDFTLHRERLLALRARLQGDMTQMEDNALNHDHSKSTSMPTDMAELGSGNFDQELTLSLLGSENNALDQIEGALERIEEGSYGQCEECGVKIPKPRLEAIPYAALCVQCASQQEDDYRPKAK
jgi:DnaK suppressor protein